MERKDLQKEKNVKAQLGEEMLDTWLRSVTTIRGNRILSTMSLNEIMILRLINRSMETGDELPTAADICREHKLLKSQVNSILNDMEKKGMIERVRSDLDRRKVRIGMNDSQRERYFAEHREIMQLFDAIENCFQEEELRCAIRVLNTAADLTDRLLEG